jgi:hypothetical protein
MYVCMIASNHVCMYVYSFRHVRTYVVLCLRVCVSLCSHSRPRLCNVYRACHWTQGSCVQTRPRVAKSMPYLSVLCPWSGLSPVHSLLEQCILDAVLPFGLRSASGSSTLVSSLPRHALSWIEHRHCMTEPAELHLLNLWLLGVSRSAPSGSSGCAVCPFCSAHRRYLILAT